MKNSDRKIIYTGFRNGYTGEPIQFEIVGNEYSLDIDKGRGYIKGKRMYSRLFIKRV